MDWSNEWAPCLSKYASFEWPRHTEDRDHRRPRYPPQSYLTTGSHLSFPAILIIDQLKHF